MMLERGCPVWIKVLESSEAMDASAMNESL
jgi:hypothetical protein